MAEESQTIESVIAHSPGVEAAINAPPGPVPLYHPDGREIMVPAAQAEPWLREGWLTEKYNLADLAAEIKLLFQGAAPAVDAFVAEVLASEAITTGAEAASFVSDRAMEDLVAHYGRIRQAAHARYPVAQETAGVPMRVPAGDAVHPEGALVSVDPSQVAMYAAQRGFVVDPAAAAAAADAGAAGTPTTGTPTTGVSGAGTTAAGTAPGTTAVSPPAPSTGGTGTESATGPSPATVAAQAAREVR